MRAAFSRPRRGLFEDAASRGAAFMFQVTEKASEKIGEFFKDKEEISPIRIFLSQGG